MNSNQASNSGALATKRFLDSFDRCSDQDIVRSEIASLLGFLKMLSDGEVHGWPIDSKPIKGLPKSAPAMREWRISASGRIIFIESPTPTLVDFNLNHTSVETFTKLSQTQIAAILKTSAKLPDKVSKFTRRCELLSKLTSSDGVFSREVFVEEQFDDWLYFLSENQLRVKNRILNQLKKTKGFSLNIIFGGAGTGKTVLLTNLAIEFDSWGLEVQFDTNKGVSDHLKSGHLNVPGLNFDALDGVTPQVLLVDDPISLGWMEYTIESARVLDIPIVVGIDPTQWHERKLASKWEAFQTNFEFTQHVLTENYRQGGGVGKPALGTLKNFFDNSSAFVSESKVASELSTMAEIRETCIDKVTFIDQKGGFEVHEVGWLLSELENELSEFQKIESAKKWPQLLIGHEPTYQLPSGVPQLLKNYKLNGIKHHQKNFNAIGEVRGVEYDFVILFVPEAKWRWVTTGKLGAGTNEWESLNTMLTFLTRAKNYFSIYLTNQNWNP